MARVESSRVAPRPAAAAGIDQLVLSIDGRTNRRSHDRKKGLGVVHSVAACASDFGLTLGQVACDEKSREIAAISELPRLLDAWGVWRRTSVPGTLPSGLGG